MSNNYDDYGYDDENKSGLLKKILVVSLIVISIIMFIKVTVVYKYSTLLIILKR